MWGYFENGKCIATNPNNMKGNSGWEKVPDDTIPVEIEVPMTESPSTLEQRVAAVEAVVQGTPTYGELLEAVNILLGE
jgi:hypothetical protein